MLLAMGLCVAFGSMSDKQGILENFRDALTARASVTEEWNIDWSK
jgi:hypothetical protein